MGASDEIGEQVIVVLVMMACMASDGVREGSRSSIPVQSCSLG